MGDKNREVVSQSVVLCPRDLCAQGRLGRDWVKPTDSDIIIPPTIVDYFLNRSKYRNTDRPSEFAFRPDHLAPGAVDTTTQWSEASINPTASGPIETRSERDNHPPPPRLSSGLQSLLVLLSSTAHGNVAGGTTPYPRFHLGKGSPDLSRDYLACACVRPCVRLGGTRHVGIELTSDK